MLINIWFKLSHIILLWCAHKTRDCFHYLTFLTVISDFLQLNDIDFQDSVMTLGFSTELSQELLQLYKQVRNSTIILTDGEVDDEFTNQY